MRPWVVQKFGGTSVGKFPLNIARDIVDVYEKDHRVVIVCSARSTNVKAEGTTSRLLLAAQQALSTGEKYAETLDAIATDHVVAAEASILDVAIREQFCEEVKGEITNAKKILEASRFLDEVSLRTMDLVLSAGERIACIFVVAVLKGLGRKAQLVDFTRIYSGSCTDLNRDFYADLQRKMADAVEDVDDAIPVVTGFFGLLPGGLISNVGRGYTDLCAALVAVGLRASELQIWKEVDGIFTADPSKVPTARLLDQITPEEAAELTYYGSEVIHPYTMEQAIRARIPIRIKNVKNPKGNGTRVFPSTNSLPGEETPLHPPIAHIPAVAKGSGAPTAITSKKNVMVFNVHSNKTRQSHGFLAQVFLTLDRYKLVVDLISTTEVHISMAINITQIDTPISEAVQDLRRLGTVDVTYNLAIVSLVGVHMKQQIGIASRMFSTLAAEGINLEMISQGASEINISTVIHEKSVTKAVAALHDKLLLPSLEN